MEMRVIVEMVQDEYSSGGNCKGRKAKGGDRWREESKKDCDTVIGTEGKE